jgi:hypothetical protein
MYSSTHSLTSALDGGEWSASRPDSFNPREWIPDTHWIGGWMSPRAGLDTVVKKKFPAPTGTRTTHHPTRRPPLNNWTPSYVFIAWCVVNYVYKYIMYEPVPKICWFRIVLNFVGLTCEADHSPPSSVEVKNAWSCTATLPYIFIAWYLVKHR